MTGDDLEKEERRWLTALLSTDTDDGLSPVADQPPAVEGASWSAGFADEAHGIRLAVYSIRDPDVREAIASVLREPFGAGTTEVTTNGALLLVVATARDDVADRMDELLGRFAGEE